MKARLDSMASGWFKSSFSNPKHACVEVNFDNEVVHVRDSKDHGAGPIITVRAAHWPGFLAEVLGRAETGSNQAVRVERSADGGVQLHTLDSDTALSYTGPEWDAFTAGAASGEFDHLPAARSEAMIGL